MFAVAVGGQRLGAARVAHGPPGVEGRAVEERAEHAVRLAQEVRSGAQCPGGQDEGGEADVVVAAGGPSVAGQGLPVGPQPGPGDEGGQHLHHQAESVALEGAGGRVAAEPAQEAVAGVQGLRVGDGPSLGVLQPALGDRLPGAGRGADLAGR